MAHANLGHALAGKGDAAMAARSYRRALALDPDHEVAEEVLKALEKLGVRADGDRRGRRRLMKLLLVIIEGQLYLAGIVAIFVAELAFLLWGLWSRRPIIGLVAVFVTVPLMRTTVSAIRACFVQDSRRPKGLPLDAIRGPALLRSRRGGPARRSTRRRSTASSSPAASMRAPRSTRRRGGSADARTLVLGLPVLTTLSAAELRAVIAHELAHFSSAHDAFAAWVYRTRRELVRASGGAGPKAGDSHLRLLAHSAGTCHG